MRVSMKENDPGYNPYASKCRVFLDGELQDNCFTADEELGQIYCYVTNDIVEFKQGRVRLEWPTTYIVYGECDPGLGDMLRDALGCEVIDNSWKWGDDLRPGALHLVNELGFMIGNQYDVKVWSTEFAKEFLAEKHKEWGWAFKTDDLPLTRWWEESSEQDPENEIAALKDVMKDMLVKWERAMQWLPVKQRDEQQRIADDIKVKWLK